MVPKLEPNLVSGDAELHHGISAAGFVEEISSEMTNGEAIDVVQVCPVLFDCAGNQRTVVNPINASIKSNHNRCVDVGDGRTQRIVTGR